MNNTKILCGFAGLGLSAFLVWMGRGGVENALDGIHPAFAWVVAASLLLSAAAGWAWAADHLRNGRLFLALFAAAGALAMTAGCAYFDEINLQNGLAIKNAAPLAEAEASSAVATAELERIRVQLEGKQASWAEFERQKQWEVSPDNPTPGKGRNYWDAVRALDVLGTELGALREAEATAKAELAKTTGLVNRVSALQNGLTDVPKHWLLTAFFVLELWASLLLGAAMGGSGKKTAALVQSELQTEAPKRPRAKTQNQSQVIGLYYRDEVGWEYKRQINGRQRREKLGFVTRRKAEKLAMQLAVEWEAESVRLPGPVAPELEPAADRGRTLGELAFPN